MEHSPFQIQTSSEIIKPNWGSLSFTIPSPHPLISQPLGWGLIRLEWPAPTLIEPFLKDLQDFITQSLISLKHIDTPNINSLYHQIQTRFTDWKADLCLVLLSSSPKLSIFISSNLKAHLFIDYKPHLIPTHSSITHFLYDPTKKHPLFITTQNLPPTINIINVDQFVKSYQKTPTPFLFVKPTPRKKFFQPFRPPLKTKPLFLFSILFLFLGFIIFISYHNSSSRLHNPMINSSNPQSHKFRSLLIKLQNQADKDPLTTLRLLDQIEAEIYQSQIDDPTTLNLLNQLKNKLQLQTQENYPTTSLTFNNKPLKLQQLIFNLNKLYLLTPTHLFSLPPKPGHSLKILSTNLPKPPFLDMASDAQSLFILTPEGVFWLKSPTQTIQITSFSSNLSPNHLAFYAGNLYLLTSNGQIYKLNNWVTSYPQTPKLYFSDPQIAGSQKIIPHKKIYILTQTGQLKVFYFGKPQNFTLDSKILPLTDLYLDTNSDLFYFLNPKGFGTFDLSGKLISWTKHPNNYQFILKTPDYLIFYSNSQLIFIPHENEK